jgi:hypothetical protein
MAKIRKMGEIILAQTDPTLEADGKEQVGFAVVRFVRQKMSVG